MRNLWILQVVCAILLASASWSLIPLLLLALADKQEPVTYGHCIFCILVLIIMLLSIRVVYELIEEKEEFEN